MNVGPRRRYGASNPFTPVYDLLITLLYQASTNSKPTPEDAPKGLDGPDFTERERGTPVMGMQIATNVAALNAQRNLAVTGVKMGKVLEKLSSGFRINRAADDAAGLGTSEKMRAQIRGSAQAVRNAQDGI